MDTSRTVGASFRFSSEDFSLRLYESRVPTVGFNEFKCWQRGVGVGPLVRSAGPVNRHRDVTYTTTSNQDHLPPPLIKHIFGRRK
ncbi:hypothetical protein E2C01_000609 [Portunus trituberculatus]|uniref:Uncharacterized protein n=1 Tax=Portunus trituberculatus TaxID=210409 RepID=A0A5B7CFM3_PORTR|nr:hypothetical protein [Portunus trituberculatus]